MSAAAFTVTPFGITLISDGAATSEGKIVNKNSRKVWKLSPSVGLIWMGQFFSPMSRLIDPVMGMSAEDAINKIADTLRAVITDNPEWKKSLATRPYNVFTFECGPTGVQYYRLFYKDDRFTPVYKGELKPRMNGALVIDTENPPWSQLTNKHWKKYQREFSSDIEAIQATESACRDAFKEMIELYKAEGKPVGGKIFIETIRPPG